MKKNILVVLLLIVTSTVYGKSYISFYFTPIYDYVGFVSERLKISFSYTSHVCYGGSIEIKPERKSYHVNETLGDYTYFVEILDFNTVDDNGNVISLDNITSDLSFKLELTLKVSYISKEGLKTQVIESDMISNFNEVEMYPKTSVDYIDIAVNGYFKDTYSLPNGELTQLSVVADGDDLQEADYLFEMIYNPTNTVYNCSSLTSTKQFFYLEGEYTARINITDKNGCNVGEFVKENFITVQSE